MQLLFLNTLPHQIHKQPAPHSLSRIDEWYPHLLLLPRAPVYREAVPLESPTHPQFPPVERSTFTLRKETPAPTLPTLVSKPVRNLRSLDFCRTRSLSPLAAAITTWKGGYGHRVRGVQGWVWRR